jgi:hypothetical protein
MRSLDDEIKVLVNIVKTYSPKAFINRNNELIVEPRNNIYFRLDNVTNEMELKCKILAWLSRPSCKGVSNYWQKRILQIVNNFLETTFTKDQIIHVYTYLGNDINRKLSIAFIESGYDLSVLPGRKIT